MKRPAEPPVLLDAINYPRFDVGTTLSGENKSKGEIFCLCCLLIEYFLKCSKTFPDFFEIARNLCELFLECVNTIAGVFENGTIASDS
jgi:hypothetical protein